ncbi:MAG: FtsX-like permease family protein [Calditrichota bacterium]
MSPTSTLSFYLALAWRNIWRNRRRSLISIASVLFAVIIALATRSMQLGTYARLIENMVSFYTGYAQIQSPEYWDTHSLDDSFVLSDSLFKAVTQTPHITAAAPRLEAFGLVSGKTTTTGALIVGVDPGPEARLTHLDKRVKSGRFIDQSSRGALVAKGLAEHLNIDVGDTLVVLSQGYHGVTAAAKLAVEGLLDFPSPTLNACLIYLTLPAAQELFDMNGRVTSLAVMVDKPKRQEAAVANLKQAVGGDLTVLTWQDMLPEVVQYIEMDNSSGIIMLLIIYLVIGFGILGTILMMTLERRREFGMLIAVGMKRGRIRLIILLESIILTLIGVLSGVILGFPILLYLYLNPIPLGGEWAVYMERYGFEPVLPFSLDPMIFVWQTLSVLAIALVVAIFPLLQIRRIKPAAVLRTG